MLCGGRSQRMGTDKALIVRDGQVLAARVAAALRAAGADRVLAIGGDAPRLAAAGLEPVVDRWPGEGPLGGLATALDAVRATDGQAESVLLLAPCDLRDPSGSDMARLVPALLAAPAPTVAAVAAGDGRDEWIVSAWRASAAVRDRIEGLLVAGRRRLDAAAECGPWVQVSSIDPGALRDVDAPEDLE